MDPVTKIRECLFDGFTKRAKCATKCFVVLESEDLDKKF